MGNLLAIVVHAANIHDTVGGTMAYDKAIAAYPSITGMCGDMGYRGTFVDFVKVKYGETIDISEKIQPKEEMICQFKSIIQQKIDEKNRDRGLIATNYTNEMKSTENKIQRYIERI